MLIVRPRRRRNRASRCASPRRRTASARRRGRARRCSTASGRGDAPGQPATNSAQPASAAPGTTKPASRAISAQPRAVLAGDPEAHLLAAGNCPGCAAARASAPCRALPSAVALATVLRRRGRVDKAPIGFLQPPGSGDRRSGSGRGPRSAPSTQNRTIRSSSRNAGHQPERQIVRHDPAIVPLVDRLQRGVDHPGAIDRRRPRAAAARTPHRPTKPADRAEEHPADRRRPPPGRR